MNAPSIVNGEVLGRMLRPEQPISRRTIYRWTISGQIPRDAVTHRGRCVRYLVPRLIAAGLLLPQAVNG